MYKLSSPSITTSHMPLGYAHGCAYPVATTELRPIGNAVVHGGARDPLGIGKGEASVTHDGYFMRALQFPTIVVDGSVGDLWVTRSMLIETGS